MDIFDNIYRKDPVHEEVLKVEISDPLFRYADMLGGAVALRSAMEGKRLGYRGMKAIISDAFRLAFYQLVACQAIEVKVLHFQRVFFDHFKHDGEKIILERNPDFSGFKELESPLCAAIYAACEGRTIAKVVKLVLNGYMGPGTSHDHPVKVLFSALTQGEMRGWRLSREVTGWGFFHHYNFKAEEGHEELLTEAYHDALKGLSELMKADIRVYRTGEDFRRRVFLELDRRKQHEQHHHHHYPKHPRYRKPKRRKKRKRDDDPRMWMEQ